MNRPLLSDPTPTPGPWKYAGWDAVGCDVYRNGDAPAECDKVATVAREADAQLIAAAPDLLAFALEMQREYAAFMANDLELYPERLIYHASGAGMVVAKATGVAESPDE